LNGSFVPEAEVEHLEAFPCGKVAPAIPSRVIPVSVGDDGPVHGLQRVYKKIPDFTVKAFIRHAKDLRVHHQKYDTPGGSPSTDNFGPSPALPGKERPSIHRKFPIEFRKKD
jgi:hypothetical protein